MIHKLLSLFQISLVSYLILTFFGFHNLSNPYAIADELDITSTSLIGTIIPPLERAPSANCRVADASGNTLSNVSIDQQVQITCDITNGQDREQQFTYLVQVKNSDNIAVHLAWITGSLSAGQTLSPSLSGTSQKSDVYDVTAFVWENLESMASLSNTISLVVDVR